MEQIFGLSMNTLMWILVSVTSLGLGIVGVLAWKNPVILKLGVRNIPRRPTQTVLIIVGVMLSSIIISAAFGTGDTISYSIRAQAVEGLGPIDELVFSTPTNAEGGFGANAYFPFTRFEEIQAQIADFDSIDAIAPGVGEIAAALNPRTGLSEGTLRVTGVDPKSVENIGFFKLISGEAALLDTLGDNDSFINKKAATLLDAQAGDNIELFRPEGTVTITIAGIVEGGGLAGNDPTLILRLSAAQKLFEREGQINSIAISNRGDYVEGAELSETVTEKLRLLFADEQTATELQRLLILPNVASAIAKKEASLTRESKDDIIQLRSVLASGQTDPELIGLLTNPEIEKFILDALEDEGLQDLQIEADNLFRKLSEFRVVEIKRTILEIAERVSSFATTFFLLMGLFSIMVGILLIFLIFVMLAAARRSEMGMARAVGAKRSHLVQMFLFEGTAYSVVSAAIGVAIGLVVSSLVITAANSVVTTFDEDFRFTRHFEPRTIIISYCLGMAITFVTVAISAYQVSQLNIVAAIRDLPTPISVRNVRWRSLFGRLLTAIIKPFLLALRALRSLATLQIKLTVIHIRQMIWALISLPWEIYSSLMRILWRPATQGWLIVILGAITIWQGIQIGQAAPFTIGVSMTIIGVGLMGRAIWSKTKVRADRRDRITYSFIGLTLLTFWLLPFDTLEPLTGELDAQFEMFFVSGISVVAAAVWTVIYNSDMILRILTIIAGRFGRLRPVLVTAVAYPMSSKFRTGLTLMMFALVIFTLIVMSILSNAFNFSTLDHRTITGGWDIEGEVNFNTPIRDFDNAIQQEQSLAREDFTAIGGFTQIPIQARQIGAKDQRWQGYAIRAADDGYLTENQYKLEHIAEGYGPTERDVWQALQDNPNLAIVDALVIERDGRSEDRQIEFQLEGISYEDEEMLPITIQIREPRTGVEFEVTIIGVLTQLSDSFGDLGFGMLIAKDQLDKGLPFPVPITTYRARLAEGASAPEIKANLEKVFQKNGMKVAVLQETIQQDASAQQAFNRIFTSFMALGLLVGVAALGVISLRAVVERRQQIGVLRALGYRQYMIQLSFLLESSFVALLGIAIGVALGATISYNIVADVRESANIQTLSFSIPWMRIGGIIAATYAFSLVTTFLPARQASKIYPAEALRYE